MKKTPSKVENLKLKEKSEGTTSITHVSKRSYKLNETTMVKYLNLTYFKLNPCSSTKTHNHKHCMNYHTPKDRKRFGQFYSDTMCPYITNGEKCPDGDNCTNAHSRVQQLYQTQTYKKKFCSHFPNNVAKCQYGIYCSFAHSQEQIQVQLIHNYTYDQDFYMFYYKTQFCPFNLTEHDKALCVYAHNLQDYRRNPTTHFYEPIACFNWKLKDYIYEYDQGCENGVNCNMCHGWKQLQYHPSLYHTKKCLEVGCKRGECPNFHSQKQKRVIPQEVQNHCFRLVPRNRILNGVFKEEYQEKFIPRHQITTQSVVFHNNNSSIDKKFTTKTIGVPKYSTSLQPEREYQKYILDQSPVDSQGEDSSSAENQVQNQIQKLDLE